MPCLQCVAVETGVVSPKGDEGDERAGYEAFGGRGPENGRFGSGFLRGGRTARPAHASGSMSS